MTNSIITYHDYYEHIIYAIHDASLQPIPAGPHPGPGWESVNRHIDIWNQFNLTDTYWRSCYKMCASHQAIQDITTHTGSMVQLPSRTVAVLNATEYDTIGLGPIVGGLNGYHLNQNNAFARSGVEFHEARKSMLVFMELKFDTYKAHIASGNPSQQPRITWVERE